jgi:dimethylargininase
MRVIVRPPSPAFRDAISNHPGRSGIDPALALRQHEEFVTRLRSAGADVVALPAEEGLPDAPFVSDTLLALPRTEEPEGPTRLLVLTRPGAPARRPEVATAAPLARRLVGPQAVAVEIHSPGTLDGGDVIVFGRRVAIGVSARTNEDGASQLAMAVEMFGYRPFLCPVEDRLHLASEVTVLGPAKLVGTRAGFASLDAAGSDVAPAGEVERVLLADEDAVAANVLALGGRAFVAEGRPNAVAALRTSGEDVVEVDLSQFTLADGGPTCLVGLVP